MTKSNKPLAGLTGWVQVRDRQTRVWTPAVPDQPGIIHAVRPLRNEPQLRAPSFIEDTYMYRAALCGAKVKVIMPTTFKPDEEGACKKCTLEDPTPELIRPGTPAGKMFTNGDAWSPRAWRRRQREEQKAAKSK